MTKDDQCHSERTDASRSASRDDRRKTEKERNTAPKHGTDDAGKKRSADEPD